MKEDGVKCVLSIKPNWMSYKADMTINLPSANPWRDGNRNMPMLDKNSQTSLISFLHGFR